MFRVSELIGFQDGKETHDWYNVNEKEKKEKDNLCFVKAILENRANLKSLTWQKTNVF